MDLEHAKLKGEDHFVELHKYMGWYLEHFPEAKRVCTHTSTSQQRRVLYYLRA